MKWSNQSLSVQVDVTSYCNARCGGCARNINGGEVQPWLELNHLDKELWYRFCTQDTIDQTISHLKFNGNWGDAGIHTHFPEMISVFGKCNPEASIQVCTNGGTRNTEWWSKLGNAFVRNTKYHTVDFALDGLEDTHSIYRRSTDYNKILNNAEAFISAGGKARWIMTLFDYNIHQIDEAIEVAKNNKFASIKFRYSHSKNSKVKTDTEEYILYTDKADKISLPQQLNFEGTRMSNNILEVNESKCPWYRENKIQISPWGNVWPCCYVADAMEGLDDWDIQKHLSTEMDMNPDWNNLNEYTLTEILDNTWFTDKLDKAVEHGTYEVCRKQCNV